MLAILGLLWFFPFLTTESPDSPESWVGSACVLKTKELEHILWYNEIRENLCCEMLFFCIVKLITPLKILRKTLIIDELQLNKNCIILIWFANRIRNNFLRNVFKFGNCFKLSIYLQFQYMLVTSIFIYQLKRHSCLQKAIADMVLIANILISLIIRQF